MSITPFALRKQLLSEAKELLELPQPVLNDLMRCIKRQDKETYDMLRSCMVEVRQAMNHENRNSQRTRQPGRTVSDQNPGDDGRRDTDSVLSGEPTGALPALSGSRFAAAFDPRG